MKNVLLVGCGAEIGAMLVGMNEPQKDGFRISAILTHPIFEDSKHLGLGALDSLYARIVLAQPQLLDDVECDPASEELICRGNRIKVHWGDCIDFDLSKLGKQFEVCILATSKTHIGDDAIIGRFGDVANFVIGVAEAAQIPSLYPNLIGVPERFLANPPRALNGHRVMCVGSCQSNGWQAQLRPIFEMAEELDFESLEILGLEIDIIHPDTPAGRLGTKSIEARSQDPRDNLRPSFSQVEMAMNLLFPDSNNINTISLRTLIMPPGYQICRFFFRYQIANGVRLTRDDVEHRFAGVAKRLPKTLRMADRPLGSRGFEASEASAIVLAGERYFRYCDNPFKIDNPAKQAVSRILTQAYVHNVRGYCRSVLDTVQHLLTENSPRVFFD